MKHLTKVTTATIPVAKANVFDDIANWFQDVFGGHHTTKISW